jgi:hypothetical protein
MPVQLNIAKQFLASLIRDMGGTDEPCWPEYLISMKGSIAGRFAEALEARNCV